MASYSILCKLLKLEYWHKFYYYFDTVVVFAQQANVEQNKLDTVYCSLFQFLLYLFIYFLHLYDYQLFTKRRNLQLFG